MAVDRDAEHLPLHASVEALHHAVRARRVGPCRPVLHLQLAAGRLEAVRHEAGATVGEHMCDPEGQSGKGLFQEGHRRGGGLVILDR